MVVSGLITPAQATASFNLNRQKIVNARTLFPPSAFLSSVVALTGLFLDSRATSTSRPASSALLPVAEATACRNAHVFGIADTPAQALLATF